IGRHQLLHPRRRLLALPPGARVPGAVEQAQRVLGLGGEQQRLMAVHVVGTPLGLEVDLVLVGEPRSNSCTSPRMPVFFPCSAIISAMAVNGQDAEVRRERQPEPPSAVGPRAVALAVLLGEAERIDLGPGRRGHEFLKGFLAHCARTGAPLDFVSFHTKGGRFTPWRVYGPLGGPAPSQQSPSSLKMLREVRAALDAVSAHPKFRDLPCIVDECDASVPAHWGVYDNANFAYRNTEYFPAFQCKLMKKLLDLDTRGGARVHQATTWSFYFEGERFFEGTRSL